MDTASIFAGLLSIIYLLLIIGTFIIILTENSNSSRTIAWLLVLMIIPALGLILYYVFGYSPRRNRKTPSEYDKFKTDFVTLIPPTENVSTLAALVEEQKRKIRPEYNKLVELLERSNDSAVLHGSQIQVMTNGREKFERLMNDLENARHHIHIEYFYFRKDGTGMQIREILMRKASQGVKVRFIYENIANIDISPRYYYDMRKKGVEVLPFTKASLPWIRRNLNNRDHRKIAVIDGEIGYTGGMNIGDSYAFDWRDTHLRIQGQGVYGLQYNFLHIWYESGGGIPADLDLYFPPTSIYTNNLMQVVPEAPDSPWPYMLLASVNIVSSAKKYIYIQTPYYMPESSLLQTLKAAALSGVDVRVMVSRKADIFFMDPAIHSFYEESLRAGIRIYEFKNTFIHAKTMVVDDYISVIGSSNMDERSLDLSFEINTYMYDEEMARFNYNIFMNDLVECREVKLEEWERRPWWRKIIESVMRLFSPLL